MRITFLGHQGWQFENNGRSFLLDPILEEMGNGAVRLPVWPRRRLDFARFEPLDAVIVSHEHADHFSIETLSVLPRRCRILVSDLSSYAMTTAIAEMGFQVERFGSMQRVELCGIEITVLPGLYNTLEPDTYALLMRDASGASFLTGIDTVAHPEISAWLARNCPNRTLDNLTNNFVEPRQGPPEQAYSATRSRSIVAGNVLDFVQKYAPRRAVVSGQGWSFKDSKAALNNAFFSVDNAWVTRIASDLAPEIEWFEGRPGMRFTLNGGEVTVDESTAVGPVDRPSRRFDAQSGKGTQATSAWTGVSRIPAERLQSVRSFICERYAQVLEAHAPRLMEKLYYLKCQGAGERSPTFAVLLRNGDSRTVFELDYGHLMFREAPRLQPLAAVGLELWASDLELLLAAGEEVFTVYESAMRPWSCVPDLIEPAALIETLMWFTPRHRPKEFLDFYRARIAERRSPVWASSR